MDRPLVLVADDNEATCTLLTALLKQEYAVETARDGHEAIERLKVRRYAVILLDLLMPQADGYDVLEFLGRERPELISRVLVVTASLSTREMQRVREYAVAGVVAKPFEIDGLLDAVRRCAGSKEPHYGPGPLLNGSMLLLLTHLVEIVRR